MHHPPPPPPRHPTDRLVGAGPALTALRTQLQHLAAFDTLGKLAVPTMLLQGATGTGKGLVARAPRGPSSTSTVPRSRKPC